jgi:hypothetical protein
VRSKYVVVGVRSRYACLKASFCGTSDAGPVHFVDKGLFAVLSGWDSLPQPISGAAGHLKGDSEKINSVCSDSGFVFFRAQ